MAPLGLALAAVVLAPARADLFATPIRTDDVDLRLRLLDAAGGKPDAPALQRGYLDVGSPGVRDFIPDRITSATELAAKVAREPGA